VTTGDIVLSTRPVETRNSALKYYRYVIQVNTTADSIVSLSMCNGIPSASVKNIRTKSPESRLHGSWHARGFAFCRSVPLKSVASYNLGRFYNIVRSNLVVLREGSLCLYEVEIFMNKQEARLSHRNRSTHVGSTAVELYQKSF